MTTQTTQTTQTTRTHRIVLSAVAAASLLTCLALSNDAESATSAPLRNFLASEPKQALDTSDSLPAFSSESVLTPQEQAIHRAMLTQAKGLESQAKELREKAVAMRQADKNHASLAALGDGATTLGALASGATELNPLLPGSPLGVVGVTLAKVLMARNVEMLGGKDQDANARMMSAGWGGATVSNLAGIAGLALPVAVPLGIAGAVMIYKSKTGDGSASSMMAKAKVLEDESAGLYASAQSYQRLALVAALKRKPLQNEPTTQMLAQASELQAVGSIGALGEASSATFPVLPNAGLKTDGSASVSSTMGAEQAALVQAQLQAGLSSRSYTVSALPPVQIAQATPQEQPATMDAATAALVARQVQAGLRMGKAYAVPVVKPQSSPADSISWSERLEWVQQALVDAVDTKLRTASDVYERAIAYVRETYPETVAIFKPFGLSSEVVSALLEPVEKLQASFKPSAKSVRRSTAVAELSNAATSRIVRETLAQPDMTQNVGVADSLNEGNASEMVREGGSYGLEILPVQELRSRPVVHVKPEPNEPFLNVGPTFNWFK